MASESFRPQPQTCATDSDLDRQAAIWRIVLVGVIVVAMGLGVVIWQRQFRAPNFPPAICFVGNSQTRGYHVRECPQAAAIPPRLRVGFRTGQEARRRGFKPCDYCWPDAP